jgi:hypothetical protein
MQPTDCPELLEGAQAVVEKKKNGTSPGGAKENRSTPKIRTESP